MHMCLSVCLRACGLQQQSLNVIWLNVSACLLGSQHKHNHIHKQYCCIAVLLQLPPLCHSNIFHIMMVTRDKVVFFPFSYLLLECKTLGFYIWKFTGVKPQTVCNISTMKK